ncbi:MFS general substrate transporter [Cryphonectria parasitica EP155]|uniref:MFS general substrate transporter n=1 Tax=Cryphonectria parasitica (strain ATCC 38755 / EP155) TaxID=660469 RepID=A0A9P4XXN9_CRYP1|nr:MFS general substrate transporter [Cryphonectria parasitica EP155]KAF3762818.1 MFS general substrate transporter [Cryphonectria parasitica EP155]
MKPGLKLSNENGGQSRKGPRFWLILIAAALAALLTTLEATITSTVLPTIVADLGGGDGYIWAVDGYFLTIGIAGGSVNMAMLIASRVIQGIGGSGINVLVETVVCDLVPLRERGKYMSALFGMIALGTALGPLFGGLIVTYSSWRWVFYMALPVGGPALVLLFVFLHVNYDKSNSLATKVQKLDWLGNMIFVGASCSVLLALSWAGSVYPWSSYQIIVPLVIGIVALGGFGILEGSRLVMNPMMPLHLFSNRTSTTTFMLTFLHGFVSMWALYFLPVYFQGVLGATPNRSGIMFLPTILTVVPSAIIGGLLVSKFGRYKPIFFVGFAIILVGFGLFTLLTPSSSTGVWVGFQVIESAGVGITIPSLLPAVLAPLSDKDTALATGTWAFMRSFGLTWGTAVAAAVFDNRAAQLAASGAITDKRVAAQLMAGGAYSAATAEFLDSLSAETRTQVSNVLNTSLKRSWQVAIAFAAVGLLLVMLLKEIPLRKELLDNEFGMIETRKDASSNPSAHEAGNLVVGSDA